MGKGKVEKSTCRWCWGLLVASKLPIYYIKSPFWPQYLKLGTTGSPDQFEKIMKKHLYLHKTLTESLTCFRTCLKSGKKVS